MDTLKRIKVLDYLRLRRQYAKSQLQLIAGQVDREETRTAKRRYAYEAELMNALSMDFSSEHTLDSKMILLYTMLEKISDRLAGLK